MTRPSATGGPRSRLTACGPTHRIRAAGQGYIPQNGRKPCLATFIQKPPIRHLTVWGLSEDAASPGQPIGDRSWGSP